MPVRLAWVFETYVKSLQSANRVRRVRALEDVPKASDAVRVRGLFHRGIDPFDFIIASILSRFAPYAYGLRCIHSRHNPRLRFDFEWRTRVP